MAALSLPPQPVASAVLDLGIAREQLEVAIANRRLAQVIFWRILAAEALARYRVAMSQSQEGNPSISPWLAVGNIACARLECAIETATVLLRGSLKCR